MDSLKKYLDTYPDLIAALGAPVVIFGPGKSEVFRLWCDNEKIRQLTGFQPEYNIRDGLKKTIDWFTRPENLARYKADIYNL